MNNQQEQDSIKDKEISTFPWYYKNHFELWESIAFNQKEQRLTCRATDNKQNPKIYTIMKLITIKENANYNNLLKEIFFLSIFKKNKYFIEIIDVFLSENNQDNKKNKKMYIIIRKEGQSLLDLIRFNEGDYNKKYPYLSRYMIFQLVCGLKILHNLGFSHNDIKLGNILNIGTSKIKICDLGSADKNGKKHGVGTNGYFSPQNLLGYNRTKEDDMFAVGIVYTQLLQKKQGGMLIDDQKEEMKKPKKNRKEINKETILKGILKNFYRIKIDGSDWDEDINYNEIVKFIKNGEYNKFEDEPKWECEFFKGINNEEDKDLIKKLLEIDPKKRSKAEDVLNMDMFKKLNFTFEQSEVNYREKDYQKYFGEETTSEATFRKHLEEIKEKFIGHVIFEKNN